MAGNWWFLWSGLMPMHRIVILGLFFLVLGAFISGAALARRRSVRLISAAGALVWSFLMFSAACGVATFNCNAWYSSAASEMLDACIAAMEQGRHAAVLDEMRRMTN